MQGLSEKRYDPQKTDARWYQVWVERGYFRADVQAPGEPFCIVIPPPKYHRISPYGACPEYDAAGYLGPLEANGRL